METSRIQILKLWPVSSKWAKRRSKYKDANNTLTVLKGYYNTRIIAFIDLVGLKRVQGIWTEKSYRKIVQKEQRESRKKAERKSREQRHEQREQR